MLSPELYGKESQFATSSNGSFVNEDVQAWSDASDSYISNRPELLIGQTFFRVPNIIDEDTRLNIKMHQASTIFIAMDNVYRRYFGTEKEPCQREVGATDRDG